MQAMGVLVGVLLAVAMMAGVARADGARIPPVGTWNVNLGPGSSSDAIDRTIEALPKDLAVLALQDIFLDEDGLQAFVTALRPSYRFSYHVPPKTPHNLGCAVSVPESACENVLGLRTTDCVQRIAADLLGCFVDYSMPSNRLTIDDVFQSPCGGHAALLMLLDPQCNACLLNAAAENGGSPQQTFNTCLAQQGPRYAHGGSVGQLILSKLPIKDVEVVKFPSYIQRRANVYATIGGVRYGFASYPSDLLADFGLSAFVPPLPGALQPVLAQEMIDSDADALLGSFWSGALYQSAAYDDLLAEFQDLAPGKLTYCTQAMIDAQDPRCAVQLTSGSLDVDHVLVRNGAPGCFRSGPSKRFAKTPGLSDHAGLRVCRKVFEPGVFAPGNILR